MTAVLASALEEAVTTTLETMCFVTVLGPAECSPEGEAVTAHVEFDGDARGVLRLALSADAARMLAAGFLGVEPDEVAETAARTVILEAANMICGCMLSTHEPSGHFKLRPPDFSTDTEPAGDPIAGWCLETDAGVIRVSVHELADSARPVHA